MRQHAAAQSRGGMEAEVRQREAAQLGLVRNQVNQRTAARFGQRWHEAKVRQHEAAPRSGRLTGAQRRLADEQGDRMAEIRGLGCTLCRGMHVGGVEHGARGPVKGQSLYPPFR